MPASDSVATRLTNVLERLLQTPLPVRLRAWDGSEAGPAGPPVLLVRNRRAVRRLMYRPDELGLARAYVAGDLDVEGDLYDALDRLAALLWRGGQVTGGPVRAVARDLVRLGVLGAPPKPPPEELRVSGTRHSRDRDRQAVSMHYDVGNDFYRILLGPSMIYSCAYWTGAGPAYGLADAQRDKLDLICRKLGLRPGLRLLDVGCGWGGLALHAARVHGVHVVGITLSREQADLARKQVAEAGLTGQIDIRIQDYRDLGDETFDAIASVGMAEHVGIERYRDYAGILYGRLRPGGRLLNHQIAALHPEPHAKKRSFIDSYVFPDGELAPLGPSVSALEEAGLEVRDVQALREHYARTLRAWVSNLEAGWSAAVRLAGPGRARVWRLYLAASALAFERGRLGVNQVLCVKTHDGGASDLPPTRAAWLA